jgi:hypothetical protein
MAIMNITCCNSTKYRKNNIEMNQQITDLTPIFNVSARTMLFINEVEEELKKSKTKLENYTPTIETIEKYSLIYIENLIYISGFMQIKMNFDKTKLDEISVKTGNINGKFITVQVPFSKFDQFLKNEEVEYFEIAIKVNNN